MTISVVQTVSSNSLSPTIASTGAGNCLVVCVMSENSSTQSVSGVTLGGSADNFASAVSDTTEHTSAFIWCDPDCAGGQTAIVISGSNLNVASGHGGVVIYEVSGLVTSGVVDKTNHDHGTSGTSWTSTATATTTQAAEFWVGCADVSAATISGPSSPWSNTSPSTVAAAGYQIAASTGTATYSGTQGSLGGPWAACVATLLGSSAVNGNVAGVAAEVTVQGGIGTPAGTSGGGNVAGVAAQVTVQGGIGTPAGGGILVVNQWAADAAQPSSFQSMPPALQSTVIVLDSGTSVGGGSGTPTPGNWLFCIAGWNQDGLTAATVGDADDIHSFWRPGNVTTSDWAVSTASGNTRTSIWYTPNLARAANDVYVAPNGAMAGTSCLVVEVQGLGPWDTVTGVASNYTAGGTTLSLTLPAPSATSFTIAAITGDSDAVSQAFAPASWTALHIVTATNGTDHTCDAVLTSAYLPSTSGSVSVSGSTGGASDLSGVILAVQVNAASPIPVGANVAWPGRMILEMGFGSGFETPPDEITWTTVSDNAPSWRASNHPRFWGWQDDSGVPYTLGQLQSSTGACSVDNFDSAFSPGNEAGPWYPDVVTGTPVRLRCALGTLTNGTVVNRWYVLSRNALEFPEKRNDAWRNYVEVALTDIWSVVSASCPTPYRGEILAESSLYAWWTMDDQPLSGGVQPTSLRNSAPGNTNTLGINASPSGVSSGDAYTTTGTDATSTYPSPNTSVPPPSVAVGAVAQQQGWMYGDPQSSPASYATSNPVTASPGSAAWQQTGMQGTGGSNGWYLAVNDTNFPALSDGITIKGWFNCGFFGSATGWHNTTTNDYYDICGQPYSQITLCTLSTGSAPVCELYLDLSGHLILETFNSGTGTTNTIYNTSDLRCNNFICVDIELTATTWAVYVNGGVTTSASGTATGMSNFTWLTLNGDWGSGGPASGGTYQHGGNVAYSHWAVFSSQLPAWRLLDHYYAAICAAGLLPAPQTVAVSPVTNEFGTGYTADGADYQGAYGKTGPSTVTSFVFSGLAVAQAGSYTSGPQRTGRHRRARRRHQRHLLRRRRLPVLHRSRPEVALYTASSAGSEEQASIVAGSGDAYTTGFGSGATGNGVCHVSGGSGAAPPSGPSALGDTVGQRLERILGYGRVTYPNRAIDPAPLAVQAACDIGGQQVGANCQAIVSSDNGLLFVDACGTLSYRQRPHLNSDTVIWNLSSAGPASGYPFQPSQEFTSDPQRVYNVVNITPYSPDGSVLPIIVPTNATAANASETQYGPRPLAVTSYLQSSSEQLAQANWLLATYDATQRRVETLTVDAAGYPPAWLFVLAASVGDEVQVTDQPMLGGPLSVGTYRISSISRKIFFGANQSKPTGSATIVADPLPPGGYWS